MSTVVESLAGPVLVGPRPSEAGAAAGTALLPPPTAVISVALSTVDGEPVAAGDLARLHEALSVAAPATSCLTRTHEGGAWLTVDNGTVPAMAVAEELMRTLARFEPGGGGRLAVGVGVAFADGSTSDLDRLCRRAAVAAAESMAARDHLVVSTTWRRAGPVLARVRALYRRVSPRRRPVFLIATSTALAMIPTFALYCVTGALGFNLAGVMFWVVFAALAFTALVNYSEAFTAFDPPALPPEPDSWPSMTVVVSAYLANEVDVVVATCRALLDQDYPAPLQLILAHNGPPVPTVEAELAALAAAEPRLAVLPVGDSSTKAQNVDAALDVAAGDVVAVFDADHRPAPGALRRAGRWLADGSGIDFVQGHCSVRNGEDGWMAKMIAVEFEAIYAVGHPGRAGLHQFGVFGGSNGFWRSELLRGLRLRPRMLTEDIDVTVRALLAGARMVSDPGLVSYEMAPTTPSALWHQRVRWAQGWSQVSRTYIGRLARAPGLSTRQRLGALWLTGWRESYAWLSAQMLPVIAYQALVARQSGIHWMLLFFCVSTVFTSAVGPLQSLFARRLAAPHMRTPDKRWWWWAYVFVWGAPYGEWRTAVCRAAHLRELLGDRAWVVTPRSGTGPVAGVSTRSIRRPEAS